MDLTFWRYVDHHVTLNGRLTTQPASIDQPAFVLVALLNTVPFRERIGIDRDAVF